MSGHQRNIVSTISTSAGGLVHNKQLESWFDHHSRHNQRRANMTAGASTAERNRIYPNQDALDHIYGTVYNKNHDQNQVDPVVNKIRAQQIATFSGPHSFHEHLLRIEIWARWVGANLSDKQLIQNEESPMVIENGGGRQRLFIFFWRLFLLVYLLQELFITAALLYNGTGEHADSEDEQMLMLYMGDFFVLYGLHVDRFSIHTFKICWGFHATFIYFWITGNHGKMRKWLKNFDRRFNETAVYVNKDLEPGSRKRMYKGARFARLFIHWSTMLATVTITGLNILGFYTREGKRLLRHPDHHRQQISLVVYLTWSLVHMIWFWLTFVINLTAFGHHFLLCRAIHIRFEEIKNDLEYAVMSERAVYTKPEHLSGLIIKHYYVCDMVKQANKHLKIYLFIFYVIFAPHLCFMIYQIIFSTNFTAQGRILLGFMLILSDFFQVYSVSVLSAQITSKSHEPYYAMHGVNKFENLPESIQLQSTLFMQRISNTVIGLTILDSFVLTGGLISSMLTAIITYFSVILENS